jgi:hypothetical protein
MRSGNERVLEVVAQFDGAILEVQHLQRRPDKPGACYEVPRGLIDGGTGAWALVREDLLGWELHVPAGCEASAPAGVTRIDASTRAWVRVGALTFFVALVEPAEKAPRGPFIDWQAQSYTASVALAAAVALALLFAVPPDPKSLALDDLLVHQRFPTFILKPPAEEPQPIVAAQQEKGSRGGKPAAGPAGKIGRPSAKPVHSVFQIQGPANNHDKHVAKLIAHDEAMRRFEDLFGARQDSQIGAIWETHESALGDAAKTVLGDMHGVAEVDTQGSNGMGAWGDKWGGGGSDHTIGAGDLRTIGAGGYHGGQGYNKVGMIPRDKKKFAAIEAIHTDTKVVGGIDKEIVRRVVHKHLNEVKFCYEKELMKRPEIGGRVLSQFTIGSNGVVVASGISSTTLHDALVEQCIAEAIKRWEFPRPDGGGIVMVQYPFVLKYAGN